MIDELLARARLRLFVQRLFCEITIVGSVFLGAVVVLLLCGTQILDVRLIAPLVILGLGSAMYRLFRSAPSIATTARLLDQRCGLSDALSTAIYFREHAADLVAAQRRHAESAVDNVDLARALPYRTPRSATVFAGMAALALGLGIFRYGFERTLPLSAPMASFRFDPFELAVKADQSSFDEKQRNARRDLISDLGASTSDDPSRQDLDTPEGKSLAMDSANKQSKTSTSAHMKTANGGTEGKPQDRNGDAQPSGENASGVQPQSNEMPSSRDGSPQSAQSASQAPGNSSSSGLLSKLKEAMNSLMSKMRQQGQNGQNPGGQQASNKQSSKGQSAKQKKGQQQGSEQKGTPEAGEESTESEFAQPGQGSSKSDQNASAKPGSGMGKQDGSKQIRDAELEAAMGKLSEIIGKRSASVSGEMTVESESGPQQLHTAYSRSTAKHGGISGDVDRDEVPVALQGYVQQYFEQVRKQAAVKAARETARSKSSNN
jgi:hypothetical protein